MKTFDLGHLGLLGLATFFMGSFCLMTAQAISLSQQIDHRPEHERVLVGTDCGPGHLTMVAYEEDEFYDDDMPVRCAAIDVYRVG